MSCSEYSFNYNGTGLSSSIQESYSLVCGREILLEVHGSFYFLGLLFGSLIAGFMSDRIGRMKWIRVSFFLCTIFGIIMALSESYVMHLVAWTIINTTNISTWVCLFVYTAETVKTDFRHVAGQFVGMFFGIGIMVGVGFSVFIPNWRHLILAYSGVAFIDFIISLFISESPRWLWARKRYEETSDIIHTAARLSGVTLPKETEQALIDLSEIGVRKESFLKTVVTDFRRVFNFAEKTDKTTAENSDTDSKKQYSVIDIFKHRVLSIRMILLALHWVCVNCLFYAILFGASMFKQNVHVYALFQGFGSFSGCVLGILLLNFFGRKTMVIFCLNFAGLVFFTCIFIPTSWQFTTLFLAFVGKVVLQLFFQLCYQWTADLMPTVVRTSALGFGSLMARITGLAIPYIGLLSEIWTPLPLIFYSSFAFLVVVATLFLPETRGKRLPNTIEEGNVFCTKFEKHPTNKLNDTLTL